MTIRLAMATALAMAKEKKNMEYANWLRAIIAVGTIIVQVSRK
jgi:hypothetical protein